MNHGTFELTFYPAPPGVAEFPVTALYRAAEERNLAVQRAGGVFRHAEPLQRQLLNTALDHRGYGLALGRAVFDGPIRELFTAALADTPSGESLHVLLSLEAEPLRELRWERLVGPFGTAEADWDFLTLNQRTTLAVYVAGATHQKFPPVGLGAINVLLVVASPTAASDAPPFDIPGAVAAVAGGLGGQVTVLARGVPGASGPPTLEQVLTHLTRGGLTVLHVVAHGTRPRGARDFCLILEKSDGAADRVPGAVLMAALQRLPGGKAPYLTFLCACDSASPGLAAHDRFADRLARDLALPAVIGMADPVSVDTATKVATAFYGSLRRCGRPDVALSEARAGLMRAFDVLIPVLVSQLGGRPLFDEEIDTPPANAEAVERGLSRLAEELRRRSPSLLGEFQKYLDRKPQPGTHGWDDALAELNNWAGEVVGVSFNGLCSGTEPPPYRADICPFNGMTAFGYDRRAFFKARERLVADLAARLRAERVLAVVGPSGSGKSSVVLAGVLPKLDVGPDGFAQFAPGADPLARLDAALAAATSPGAVLVVDQFEELFTHPSKDEARVEFLDRLKAERDRRPVIITLRSEFRERLRDTWLWGLVKESERDIQPMPADDLRRAMEEQAAEVGLRFEADLVSLILDNVGDEPGRMPLLQHTLRELWRRRRGAWLKTAAYRDLGGVHEAVARTADAFVGALDPRDHDRATDIFLRLTRVSDESDVVDQTRRRVRIADLVPAGEDDGPAGPTRVLLTRLVNEYLVVTSGGDAEVAHEALIRHWETLGAWVRRHRPALLVRQTLAAAASAWDRSGRPNDGLVHRGHQLIGAAALKSDPVLRLNQLEVKYIEKCAAAVASEKRFRTIAKASGWLAAAALVGLTAVALFQRSEALQRADDAVKAKGSAERARRAELGFRYVNQVRLLDATLRSGTISEMNALIDEFDRYVGDPANDVPYDPRGFEWYYLRRVVARDRVVLGQVQGAVRRVAYAPQRQLLAALGNKGEYRVWSLGQRREVPSPQFDGLPATDLTYGPDGTLALVGGDSVRLVHPPGDPRPPFILKEPGTTFVSVVFGGRADSPAVAARGYTDKNENGQTTQAWALVVWDLSTAANPVSHRYTAPPGSKLLASAPTPSGGWVVVDDKLTTCVLTLSNGVLGGTPRTLGIEKTTVPLAFYPFYPGPVFDRTGSLLAVPQIVPPSSTARVSIYRKKPDEGYELVRAIRLPDATPSLRTVMFSSDGTHAVTVTVTPGKGENPSVAEARWWNLQGQEVQKEQLEELNSFFATAIVGINPLDSSEKPSLRIAWGGLSGKIHLSSFPRGDPSQQSFEKLPLTAYSPIGIDSNSRVAVLVRSNSYPAAEHHNGKTVYWQTTRLLFVPLAGTLNLPDPVPPRSPTENCCEVRTPGSGVDLKYQEFFRAKDPLDPQLKLAGVITRDLWIEHPQVPGGPEKADVPKLIGEAPKQPGEIVLLAVAENGSEVALGLRDNRVLRYDPASGRCQMAPAITDLKAMGYIPGTKRLLFLARNGPLLEWGSNRAAPAPVGERLSDAQALAFDPKGSVVVVASNNQVALLDAATLQPARSFAVPSDLSVCNQLVVNPEGGFVLGLWKKPNALETQFVRWSLTKGGDPVLRELGRFMPEATTAIHPDGTRVATCRPFDTRASLLSLEENGTTSELLEFDTGPGVGSLRFAPNGQSLIVQKPGVSLLVLTAQGR
jgi:hypothetical protein